MVKNTKSKKVTRKPTAGKLPNDNSLTVEAAVNEKDRTISLTVTLVAPPPYGAVWKKTGSMAETEQFLADEAIWRGIRAISSEGTLDKKLAALKQKLAAVRDRWQAQD